MRFSLNVLKPANDSNSMKNISVFPETDTTPPPESSEGPEQQGAPENREGTKVVFDNTDAKGRILIEVTADKLKAVLKVTAASPDSPYTAEEILGAISSVGITTPINKEAILSGLASLKKQGDETVFILTGHAAAAGCDGDCELLYDSDRPFVEENQPIARMRPGVPGSAGQNIYGEALEPGPVKTPAIIAGDNVIKGDDNEFYAKISGEASFVNNVLSVHEVFSLKVSPDSMEACLTYTGAGTLNPATIMEQLQARKIIHGIDEQAIEDIAAAGTQVKDAVIARGTPPRPGRDGEIKYLFHKTKGVTMHEHLEDGVVVQGMNVIKSVAKDDEIACIEPPEEPVPGKDIFGKTIPLYQKVKKVALRPGNNVRMSGDGIHFFAEASGLPVVEGDKLSINDTLRVGSLDYTVGNIDFDGMVEIFGDAGDGFNVKATKSIIIKGVVGACNLEAGLDIQIEGGCNGQEKSRITCGGNLTAKYLNAVSVQARGDIVVNNELVDCRILCLGRVYVKAGSAYGGSIMAKKGIEALDLGNDMGIKTTLTPGEDFELNEACLKAEEALQEKNREMIAISNRIAPLMKKKEQLKNLPEETKNKLKETIQHLNELREERDQLNLQKNDLLAQEAKDAVPEVIVHRYVYAGVVLKIGKTRRQVSSQLEGPLRLYEDKEKEMISVEPYSKKR